MSNLYRLPNVNGMANLLNDVRGGNYFGNGAADYAFAYAGVNPNPPTRMTQEQRAAMRVARQSRLANQMGNAEASWGRDLYDGLQKAIDQLSGLLPNNPGFKVNTRDRKVYYSGDNGLSSDINKLRQQSRGQAAFFSPAWGVVMNYNKFTGALLRLGKQEASGLTAQDYMNRAARSAYRNLLKKAMDNSYDPQAKLAAAQRNLQARYGRMDAAINSIRSAIGGGGGGQNEL